MIFMVKKMFIKIRLCNPMTYDFKGHVKIVEIYMVKFNVSVLNSLKIMGFFVNAKHPSQHFDVGSTLFEITMIRR